MSGDKPPNIFPINYNDRSEVNKIVQSDKNAKFKTKTAAEILCHAIKHPEVCSQKTLMRLKGGQGYVYNFKDDKKSVDWKSDGYRFGSFQSGPRESNAKVNDERMGVFTHISYVALPPPEDSTSKKAIKSDSFKRVAFWLSKEPSYVLVQYVGDHLAGREFSHGNSTKPSTVHVTSNKSMRDEIKERTMNGEKSGNVYKHMTRLGVSEESTVLEVMVNCPKSHKQIRNLKEIAVAKSKHSQDEWYNAFVLVSQIKDGEFVKSFNIFPNLEITLADPQMIKEYSFLVKILHEGKVDIENVEPIAGTYDDTFNFGPFTSKYYF